MVIIMMATGGLPRYLTRIPTDLPRGSWILEGRPTTCTLGLLFKVWIHGSTDLYGRYPALQYWQWPLQFSHSLLDTDTRALYLFVGRKSEVAAWRSAGQWSRCRPRGPSACDSGLESGLEGGRLGLGGLG